MSDPFILNVDHSTTYTFSEPVFLEPHTLIFAPAHEFYFSLIEHRLEVSPTPKGKNFFQGAEGQQGEIVWFEGKHSSLKIKTTSRLKVTPYNPFSFIIHPTKYSYHPFVYPKTSQSILSSSLIIDEPVDSQFTDYADQMLGRIPTDNQGRRDTVSVLAEVTEFIHQEYQLIERTFGHPQSLSTTHQQRKGSCRDLTYFLINLFKYWKIAARFVSGYLYLEIPDEEPQFELHAWVEAYVPGPGWVGLDPSHGVYTDHNYIPVARSIKHSETLPVTGTFRGKADSTITAEVNITKEVG